MKKILTLLFVLILMCSSLATAGLFSDSIRFLSTGNLITGGVVAELQEGEEVVSEPAPEPTPEPVAEEPVAEEPTQEPGVEIPAEDNLPEQPSGDQQRSGCWNGDTQVPCPEENQQQKNPQNYNNQPIPQQDYQNQPQYNAPQQNQYVQTECGDGVCEGDEKYGCQDDCGFTQENPMTQFSGDYQKELYGEGWCAGGQCCPDGICDDFEQKMGACLIDCSGTSSGGQYGQQGMGMQNTYQVKTEIDATEALTIILKLEEIRMKLGTDGALYQQIQNLNDYCESKGTEDCSRYQNALEMMVETSNSIDTLMSDLKASIESRGKLTQEDLTKLKNNIGNIVDKGMLKITYALIGVDIDVEDIVMEETYVYEETSYDDGYVAVCGNGLCEPSYGEDYSLCPIDCMVDGIEQIEQAISTEEVAAEETTPTEEVAVEPAAEPVAEETPIEEVVV